MFLTFLYLIAVGVMIYFCREKGYRSIHYPSKVFCSLVLDRVDDPDIIWSLLPGIWGR